MMAETITADSYPSEYASPPVYGRVPSVEAIQQMQQTPRMTPAQAFKDELTAAVRATL